MTSYQRSIVAIGLSRTVSEINGDFRRISPIFPTPCILRPLGIGYRRRGSKIRMMGLPEGGKFYDRFSRLDTIPARGGATDIKMVRQNRRAAGAEASAEGSRMEAP